MAKSHEEKEPGWVSELGSYLIWAVAASVVTAGMYWFFVGRSITEPVSCVME